MNDNTLVAVCGYAGDAKRIKNFIRFQEQHTCPIVVLSPADSPIKEMRNHICRSAGKRAYIGQESLDRQIEYFKILLEYPFEYYLLNDSDSFVISGQLPEAWYVEADKWVVWVNRVEDPRPHASPYPKWAFQPPYFLSRNSMKKLISVAHKCPAHPITPYVDHFMVQLICEAGIHHRPFTDAEHPPYVEAFSGVDPWKTLEYRIKYCGTVAMHPIKTLDQAVMCARARRFYELNGPLIKP